jgi:hypothetical protein
MTTWFLVPIAGLKLPTLDTYIFRYFLAETASTRVSLFVKNVNDNVPIFKQKIYTFSAPLSTRRFTALGQVRVQPLQGIVSRE